MSDRFELENSIMNLHNVASDLDLLAESVLEERVSNDEIANAIIGLAVFTRLRVDALFETFRATFKLDNYNTGDKDTAAELPENLMAYLAERSTPDLVDALRALANDHRLSLMPAKFRCVMLEAAERLAAE
jgi:hypothetical protein